MKDKEQLRPVLAQMVAVIEAIGEMIAQGMSTDNAVNPSVVEPGSCAIAGSLRFDLRELRRLFNEAFGDPVA